jgi:hypothetical protein
MMFKLNVTVYILVILTMIISCAEKNPSRDEIPLIRTLLADFEQAVRDRNQIRLDSLISAEALPLGYTSLKILEDVYPDTINSFYSFGNREFMYVKDKASVTCNIKADEADVGRPVEITLVKAGEIWLVKRFDLK